MPFAKTFTVRESAAYLRLSTKTIRRYIKKGMLKYKMINGKHGQEIRVFKKSLDRLNRQIKGLSRGKEDIVEINRLYQEASSEVRELVLKILKSSASGEEVKKNNNLLSSIFKKRKEDYQ